MATGVDPVVGLGQLLTVFVGATAASMVAPHLVVLIAVKPSCNPDRWHGHVEHTCTASRAALYGTRSACDISRHHVHDVFARAPKYGPYLGEL